ncbi:MAG TPA: enoyl-CoA hydratase/isomerase family protein [Ramlibacter sp.]|nr:enoyl-CoA hydratase/isomerase family protein [Ramlibacter sp.]
MPSKSFQTGDASPEVLLERRGVVGIITLNRQASRNPLTFTIGDAMMDVLDEAERDDDLRALVLTGSGTVFCSGAEFGKLVHPDGVDTEKQFRAVRSHNRMVQRMAEVELPIIAAVNGPAIGGGAALALACDLAIAAPEATYFWAFGRIGLGGCDMGAGYKLPRLVGTMRAAHWLLTGATITAAQGKEAGLFLDVVPRASLLDRAVEIGQQIAAASPRRAAAITKLSVTRAADTDLQTVLGYEAYAQSYMFKREDHPRQLRELMQQLKQRR